MKRSRERVLTTHAGSLARPDGLRVLLTAKDEGKPYDAGTLAAQVRGAVAGVDNPTTYRLITDRRPHWRHGPCGSARSRHRSVPAEGRLRICVAR
jgi:hypothetical protein